MDITKEKNINRVFTTVEEVEDALLRMRKARGFEFKKPIIYNKKDLAKMLYDNYCEMQNEERHAKTDPISDGISKAYDHATEYFITSTVNNNSDDDDCITTTLVRYELLKLKRSRPIKLTNRIEYFKDKPIKMWDENCRYMNAEETGTMIMPIIKKMDKEYKEMAAEFLGQYDYDKDIYL